MSLLGRPRHTRDIDAMVLLDNKMKAVSHRAQDLMDIKSVMDAHPKLDVARIKRWVSEFANVLEMPEIWDDVAAILKGK